MKISCLTVIVISCLGLTNASPIGKTSQVPGKDGTESQTGSPLSPLLLALTLPEDHVSLLPENHPRSDERLSATISPRSAGTSEETDYPHSRGVRSATNKENQATVETTAVPITEEITTGSIKGETTAVPITEEITTGSIKGETTAVPVEETTSSLIEEKTATAPAVLELNLNQYNLDTAVLNVNLVLAKVEDQRTEIGVTNYNVDETARPMLPSDIRENAKHCVQIQGMVVAMQEVLTDFLPYLDGLTTVKYPVRALNWNISMLISPPYIYIPTSTPETNVHNLEEVMCTLMTLQTQCETIRQVLLYLKNC